MTYVKGHARRKHPHGYAVQDTGYKTPCWIWGAIGSHGYGTVWDNGKDRKAHKVFYERIHGPTPEGMQLDHLCRTRSCVNPEHLEVVTRTINLRRRIDIALTSEKVAQIRKLSAQGIAAAKLGSQFGVSTVHIYRILKYQSWT